MNHEESKLQCGCVRYFRMCFPKYAYMLFAVPNGGYRKERESKILKEEGVVAGVADLILLVPRNGKGALCIEMKARKGVQRESQKLWQEECEKAGNEYVVVRSFEQFRHVVTSYLGENDGLDIRSARSQLSNLLKNNV